MTDDEIRDALARAIHRYESGDGWDGCPACLARADAALPVVHRAQAVALCDELRGWADEMDRPWWFTLYRKGRRAYGRQLRDRADALDPTSSNS